MLTKKSHIVNIFLAFYCEFLYRYLNLSVKYLNYLQYLNNLRIFHYNY